MRCGPIRAMASMTSGARPFRGGSTQITSGCSFSAASLEAMSPASPQKNSAFSMPLAAAFSRAFYTAAETISAPMTFFALSAMVRVMVPAPQ